MKTAVYQINEGGGAYLVCVRMPSLQAAYSLEFWLKMHAGQGKEVKLLGRFDHVHAAIGQNEAEGLILGMAAHPRARCSPLKNWLTASCPLRAVKRARQLY